MLKPVLAGGAALLLSLAAISPVLAAPPLPATHGSIPADEWQSVETEHANVFYLDNSPAREDLGPIKALIEQDIARVETLLQVRLPQKLNVLIYPDRLKAPHYSAGVFVWSDDKNTVHITYEDATRRNMVYNGGADDLFLAGITAVFGFTLNPHPWFVFSEGLALYVGNFTYPRGPIEAYARRYLDDGKLYPLEELEKISQDEFLKKQPILFAETGALANYLIRTYGFEKFLQVFRKVTPKTLDATFREVYGQPAGTIEGEFRAYLRNFVLPDTRTPPSPHTQPER